MKTASRILAIVSMIGMPIVYLFYGIFLSAGGYAIIVGAHSNSGTSVISFVSLLVVYIVFCVISTVLCEITGSILLRKLENSSAKSEIIAPAIWALIFCNVLAGIFALCTRESDFGAVSSAPVNDSEHTGCC